MRARHVRTTPRLEGVVANLALQALEVFTTTLSTLSCMRSRKWVWHRVVPMLENAGSMANRFKQYIQDTCGAPSSCIHRINTAEWSAVSRNRYFFVSNSSYIVPSRQADPWQQEWMLPKPRHKPVSPPMPPWLRTRGITPGGHIRFTTSAYHPRHLLFKVDYFW